MEWMFLPLKRYAEFSGRSRRKEYWMFALFQFLLGIVFWIALTMVGGAMIMAGANVQSIAAGGSTLLLVLGVYSLVMLALIIPAIAVGARRLHDTNRSGWWLIAPMAPYILSFVGLSLAASSGSASGAAGLLVMLGGLGAFGLGITLFVFMLLEGTKGPNRFGEDPKAPSHQEVFA
jgi:uncharacterized membrane protein YhaH (DUF805 family)